MQGIESIGAVNPLQNHPAHGSKRPGTPGHPGKHLGQFKKAMAGMNDKGLNMPLIQQQLTAMMDKGPKTKAAQPAKNNDLNTQIALDALRTTQEDVSDALQFTSRFNAISTAFF